VTRESEDAPVSVRSIRPSTTSSALVLWLKSALNAVLFFAVVLALLPWLFDQLLPQPLPVHGRLSRTLALAIFAAAVLVWIWCLDLFSRQGRGTPFPLDAPRRLVTHGAYGVIRNPLIAAELSIAWAEVLYFGSLGLLLYATVLSVTGHLVVVKIEEPELRQRMGEAYEEYCARVPRWFPRLRRRKP
jgi:protein-S-isoprenylcysteine O-methyltransferase Ste14